MNRIIGVDFGTTNTVAVIGERNRLSYVPNPGPLPSLAVEDPNRGVIYYNPDGPAIPGNPIRNSKRTLLCEQEVITELEWYNDTPRLVPQLDATWEVNESIHTPEGWKRVRKNLSRNDNIADSDLHKAESAAISILRHLKDEINDHVGRRTPMDEDDIFVFSVPAMSFHYRPLLHSLAAKAGWPVNAHNFRIFPEPYAVLLAMTTERPDPGTYLVIDAGGGTTDWALVEVNSGKSGPHFKLLGTYRHDIAGRDVDEEIAKGLREPTSFGTLTDGDMRRLESEKIRLSMRGKGASAVLSLSEQQHTLTWNDIAKATTKVFDWPVRDGHEHFSGHKIDVVILAGGAAQSPGFHDLVSAYFGPNLIQPEPSISTHVCCHGLTIAQANNILSGLEQDISFVESSSQNMLTWIRAFEPLPADDSTHDKRFIFQGETRHIPLFFTHSGDNTPGGYLSVDSNDVTIRPVWTRMGLEFWYLSGETVTWKKGEFPYLHQGMPVAYENNHLKGQNVSGYGVVASFAGHPGLRSWTGDTDSVGVVVKSDPNSSVKVKVSTPNWRKLSVPLDDKIISSKDFPKYPSLPMSSLPFSQFQEVSLDWLPTDDLMRLPSPPASGSAISQANNTPTRFRLGNPVRTDMIHRLQLLKDRVTKLKELVTMSDKALHARESRHYAESEQ